VDTSRKRPGLNRRGQSLAEYATLVALVGVGLVVILGLFGRATKQAWDQSASKFSDQPAVASTGGGGGGSGGPWSGGGAVTAPSHGGGPSRGVRHLGNGPPPKDPADSTTGSESPDSTGDQHASR
jgi:Flp pilus assembly pilin Flp